MIHADLCGLLHLSYDRLMRAQRQFFSVFRFVTLTLMIGAISLSAQQAAVVRLDGSRILPSQIDAAVAQSMAAGHVTGLGVAPTNLTAIASYASILGGSAWTTARRVTVPLAMPAVLAGALIAFLQAMTLFGSSGSIDR